MASALYGAGMAASSYVLDNAWEMARRRLTLLEQCYDPGTLRRLAGLGVGRGWRCLEVGAGGGSVARWLCQRVGRDGAVVAVDLDTRFLEPIAAENLQIVQCDVVRGGLPAGEYDLVHCRALLMHVHEREQVLEAMAAAVRPGGWLLVEEVDFYVLDGLDSGTFGATWAVVNAALAPLGYDANFGRRLPELLHARGLVGLRCESDGYFFAGGSDTAELCAITWTQILEQLDLAGHDRAVAARAMAELDDPTRWFPGIPMVAVAGRRPPSPGGRAPADPYPDLLVP